jgi:hypothetical protein
MPVELRQRFFEDFLEWAELPADRGLAARKRGSVLQVLGGGQSGFALFFGPVEEVGAKVVRC